MRRVADRAWGAVRAAVGATCCAALLLGTAAQEARAVAPANWRDTLYSYRSAADQHLGDVLSRFATTLGLELKLADPALGARTLALSGKGASPADFLDRVADAQGLDWFVYQGALYVSARASARSERVTLPHQTPADAREALIGLGLFESRFGWGEFEGDPPSVLVSGPASYVRLVHQALMSADAASAPRERPKLMVFRLSHATASDREMRLRDRTIKMPGLVATLNQMLQSANPPSELTALGRKPTDAAPVRNGGDGGNSGGADAWGALAQQLAGGAAGLSAASLPLPPNKPGDAGALAPLGLGLPSTASLAGAASRPADADERGFRPAIAAYTPLNAVLVWDLPSRRDEYASIIRELDVPSQLIEINVTILDVSVNALRDWSVDVDFAGRSVGFGVSASGKIGANGRATDAAGTGSASGTGVNGSTIALWATDRLAVRLRALESRGQAQVLSRPSVLTLNNVGAMLDMNQSAYVKLVGERTADLKTITAGTLLRVTPSLVGGGIGGGDGAGAIRVSLDIEDGQLTPSASDGGAPAVGNSAVSTEALVRPGESLVVGGYRRQNRQSAHGRVPGLGSLPLVGGLFRSDSTLEEERERLFILTARALP